VIGIERVSLRLARALEGGASTAIQVTGEAALERVLELTGGVGVAVAIEAVGVPATFELCTDIVRAGGHVANVGVHGEPATLHLERLWSKDVTITTGLVDTFTTPRLMQLIETGKLDTSVFATHRFALGDAMDAYDAFRAEDEDAVNSAVFGPSGLHCGSLLVSGHGPSVPRAFRSRSAERPAGIFLYATADSTWR
jgi:alcohol dehydrogenase